MKIVIRSLNYPAYSIKYPVSTIMHSFLKFNSHAFFHHVMIRRSPEDVA
jgi:hypothetical protein